MKTVIIPVDFSAASDNAVKHAAALSQVTEYEIGRIVLVNSYHVSIYEQILPSPDLVQVSEEEITARRGQIKVQLAALKQEVSLRTRVQVDTVESDQPLMRTLLEQIALTKADMIILGSNSAPSDKDSELGEQIIEVAKLSPIPVLIVPACASYSGINTVLLPCDFKNLSNLKPLKTMQESDLWTKKKVLVLNVDPNFRRAQPDDKFKEVENSLQGYLQNIDYEVYYSDDRDTLGGILKFAGEKAADMIIALPGKHSFFYAMTHQSISQALSINGKIPVLILK